MTKKLLSAERVFVMGCAMVLVLFYHAPWINHPLIFPLRLYGLFGVDIFFFLSGFGIAHSLERNSSLARFARRRLIRLVPSCLLVGAMAVACCLLLPVGNALGEPGWLMLTSLNQWFIVTLLIYYALSPLLLRWIKSHVVPIIIVTYIICTALINVPYYDTVIAWSAARLPVYVLGLTLGSGVWNPHGRQWWFLTCMLIVGLGLRFWLAYTNQWYTHQFLNLGTFILISPGIVVLTRLLALCGRWLKSRRIVHTVVELIGTSSLEIYLSHGYIYSLITLGTANYPLMSGWWRLALGLTLGIGAGICIRLIIKRVMA